MCREITFKCHRRYIARALKKDGWNVIHIIDENKIWEEKFRKNISLPDTP